jgi:hypothetical protein
VQPDDAKGQVEDHVLMLINPKKANPTAKAKTTKVRQP